MFDEKIGVMAVGETHLSAEQAVEIQESHLGRRMDIYNSPFPDDPSTKGVALVLNRELTNTKGVKIHYIKPGRAILAVIPWHGTLTMTALAIYAPAESMEENQAFWEELCNLWMTLDLPVPDWIGGDTNLGEEPMDRLPHRSDASGAVAAFTKFKRMLEVKDGWRTVNPDTKAYTYASTNGKSLSRIDKILVSPTLMRNCRNWSIDDVSGKLTDHRMVSVVIRAPGAPFIGEGRYTIPLFLLKDTEFMKFVVEKGENLEEFLTEDRSDSTNIQTRFKAFKDEIRDFGRKRAKEAIGALEKKKRKLQDQRKDILENGLRREAPDTPDNDESTADYPSSERSTESGSETAKTD
ncbi:hypothetical protein B0H16DRAFT_1661874 [Mycena metata]|uniref:DNase I-like protein n=1 Tax=Mycena metata TaxID=1033252 RepID=A0AAD7JG96_9AGAR|nr:hypothetical protein B0H16DRAFT_1661874 [Mycena metata]